MNPAEEYILSQNEPFRAMLLEVQLLIEHTLPSHELHYKWRLPVFYYEDCPICYLNVTKGYLDVCFWARTGFDVHLETLIAENRKFVRSLRYYHPDDIDAEILIECIEEAFRTRKKGYTA